MITGSLVRLGATATVLALAGCGAAASGSVPASSTPSSTDAVPTAPSGIVRAAVTYPSFGAEQAALDPSVTRIDTRGCNGTTATGSGFVVDPTHIVTAAHVVAGMESMTLTVDGRAVPAQIVGLDIGGDLALLQLDSPVPGPYIPLSPAAAARGERVATLGYPLGQGLTMTEGRVSALDQTVAVRGTQLSGLIRTDAVVQPGSSGGPLLTLDGAAHGILESISPRAGTVGYAVSPTYAGPEVRYWISHPQSHAMPLCTVPPPTTTSTAPPPTLPPAPSTPVADPALVDEQITQTLRTYFDAITAGDYLTAWNLMNPAEQASDTSLSLWEEGLSTVTDTGVDVMTVFPGPSGRYLADVTFQSQQSSYQGPDGDTCDDWTLQYTMVSWEGAWEIGGNAPIDGSDYTTC